MPEAKPPVPRLRFPEFRDNGPWEVKQLGALVNTIPPPKKIQTSGYLPSGRFPIIDQSPNGICGWTDDETALVEADFPLVVFGDHSCVVKLAEGPFAQGADGIKILAPLADIDARFLYLYLQANPIEQRGYRRHFSTLKEKPILFPPRDTGEQQKIADCLTSLDDLIRAEKETVVALREHKRGLMQQLFPAPGETTPHLRFSEFRDAGPWEVKPLSAALDYEQPGPFIVSSDTYHSSGTPVLTPGKTFILGYTDDNDGVYERAPVIIFDDFTTDSRLVDFPFKVKSSAIKILSARYGYLLNFVFEAISLIWFDSAQHKRHWIGEFQHLQIPFPYLNEQQKIADCLSSLDELIRGRDGLVEALKDHKRGLMQRLFPREDD